MYNCNWILALTSVCLVALAGWTATRPDACEGMRLVFHNGSFGCHAVTDTGLVRFGTLDDCANECDRQHYKALGGATGRRSLVGPVELPRATASFTGGSADVGNLDAATAPPPPFPPPFSPCLTWNCMYYDASAI